jgi:hypothetical protein
MVAVLSASASALALVSADAPSMPGTPLYLEINGAKVVSEGGYFWFSIKNKGDYWVEVALYYPPSFKMYRFNTSKTVYGIGERFNDGVYSFPIEPNDTWTIGFVAPALPANLSYNSYLFTFYSAVGGLSTDKAIDTCYYDVLVVKGVINVKVDDSKLNQLLSHYNELLSKLEALENVCSKVNQSFNSIFLLSYVLSFVIGFLACAIVDFYLGSRKKKRETDGS